MRFSQVPIISLLLALPKEKVVNHMSIALHEEEQKLKDFKETQEND